ncbi:MAG: methionyl-tRNA formyltransferase [Pseudomonadota bacterium]|nr:methionyl-tRNA formyltransferase [Pseudomonadota bacterium]
MNTSLKVCFMGTPDFSVPILEKVAVEGHEIVAVYCQPPRKAGRGYKEKDSPVQVAAMRMGYPLYTPTTMAEDYQQKVFRELDFDVAVVAAYGLLLPKLVLEAPQYGCLNVHASILPRWRGAAPIQRAILAGDKETGISIMQMDEGLDTGPVILTETIPISKHTNANILEKNLSELGAVLIAKVLSNIGTSKIVPVPQLEENATYAPKLKTEEGKIDWRKSAEEIDRQVRALNPKPGAWFMHNNERIKILECYPTSGLGDPGEIVQGLTVACGKDALEVKCVQRPGKLKINAKDFLNGYRLPAGTILQ